MNDNRNPHLKLCFLDTLTSHRIKPSTRRCYSTVSVGTGSALDTEESEFESGRGVIFLFLTSSRPVLEPSPADRGGLCLRG
jgi:hypothetical protein